jgi:hypothetical protein
VLALLFRCRIGRCTHQTLLIKDHLCLFPLPQTVSAIETNHPLSGSTKMPASKKNVPVVKVPRQDTQPLLDVDDDGDSIHSRHALKVFKNGSARGTGSAISSTFSLNAPPLAEYSVNMSEEEAAEWRKYRNTTLLRAAVQLAILFVVCSAILFGTLYFALPKIDE